MKNLVGLICALALGCVAAAAGERDQKAPAQPPAKPASRAKASATRPGRKTIRPATGTRVRQTVHLDGRITDGPSPLIIITSETIKRCGYATVPQILASQGCRR